MIAPTTTQISPFIGPRPYRIEEGVVFFGRENEIADIRRRILRERVTILSAESGAGKTSLLRAGLVYALAQDRRRQGSNASVPPVLLLGEWGGSRKLGLEELFQNGLQRAIDTLQQVSLQDYALASKVPLSGKFVQDIVSISEATGELILVLDQFEEVLRAGEQTASQAVQIIKDLYKYATRVRLVLSLRSEYHKDLHGLEAYVGGLYTRTFFLRPMVVKNAQEALVKASAAAQIDVDARIFQSVVQMLLEVQHLGAAGTVGPSFDATQITGEEKIDLLSLQAILREMLGFCEARYPGIRIINWAVFEAYQAGRSPDVLAGEALGRWINGALEEPSTSKDSPLPEALQQLSADFITGSINRIAARLAAYMSSGGYKVPAEEMDLMYYALRDDYARLHPHFEDTRQEDWRLLETNPPRLHHTYLGLKPESDNLSGMARRLKWSPAETADYLVALFFEALHRLQDGNIVKPIRVGENRVWELTHDGLGRPFSAWAERCKETWEDCLYALTASKGVDIIISPESMLTPVVQQVCWQGCYIIPRQEPVLDNFEFIECDLKGTVFEGCTFRGGRFERCIMDGSLFINCIFEPGADGRPFEFINCDANAMTFLTPGGMDAERVSEMNTVVFRGCRLDQVKFAGIKITGNVTFTEESELFLCHFTRLQVDDFDRPRHKLIFENSSLLHCVWDKILTRLIDRAYIREESGSTSYDRGSQS